MFELNFIRLFIITSGVNCSFRCRYFVCAELEKNVFASDFYAPPFSGEAYIGSVWLKKKVFFFQTMFFILEKQIQVFFF